VKILKPEKIDPRVMIMLTAFKTAGANGTVAFLPLKSCEDPHEEIG
jgi:hypothetical protein